MPVAFSCPSCQAPGSAPDALAGKQARCPKCGAVLLVPADPSPPPASPAVQPRALHPGPVKVEPADPGKPGEPWYYTFVSAYAALSLAAGVCAVGGSLGLLTLMILSGAKDSPEGAAYLFVFVLGPAAAVAVSLLVGMAFMTSVALLAVDTARNVREMRRLMEQRER